MAAKNWKQSEYLSSHIYTMEYFVDMKKTIWTTLGNLEGLPWGVEQGGCW
jgi:hypothetical protein